MTSTKTEPIYYYGSLQGYKVYLNGKKYPKKHGHWYTTLIEHRAIIYAKTERLGG